MTEEEIWNIINIDCSGFSVEELTDLQKKITNEIISINQIIRIIVDSVNVNRHDLDLSYKFLDGRISPSVFPMREDEYPAAIQMEIDEQEMRISHNQNIRTVLVAKLNEVKELIGKAPKQFS